MPKNRLDMLVHGFCALALMLIPLKAWSLTPKAPISLCERVRISQYIFVGKQIVCESRQRTDKDPPYVPARATVHVLEVLKPANWNPELVVVKSSCAPTTDEIEIYMLSKPDESDSEYSPSYGFDDREPIGLKSEILECIRSQ